MDGAQGDPSLPSLFGDLGRRGGADYPGAGGGVRGKRV